MHRDGAAGRLRSRALGQRLLREILTAAGLVTCVGGSGGGKNKRGEMAISWCLFVGVQRQAGRKRIQLRVATTIKPIRHSFILLGCCCLPVVDVEEDFTLFPLNNIISSILKKLSWFCNANSVLVLHFVSRQAGSQAPL